MDRTTLVNEGQAGSYATVLVQELLRQRAEDSATVLTLAGDLGAGKTTLVQALARELGVTEVVTSPTFVVMKSYQTTHLVFTHLVHIDAYRIDEVSELTPLHFAQVLQTPQTLVCIEWPERINSALPAKVQALSLQGNPDGSRTITYYGS